MYLYMCVPECASVHHMHARACGCQKRVLEATLHLLGTKLVSASLSLLISGFKRETENINTGYWKKDWILGKADLG